MSTEVEYLRTKERYHITVDPYQATRLREMFDSFGIGTCWRVRDDAYAQKHGLSAYDVWLTSEELMALKLVFSDIWYMKIR